MLDTDGDGQVDITSQVEYVDTDGDGQADTAVAYVDQDGDGYFDVKEVYSVEGDELVLEYVEEIDVEPSYQAAEYPNYDPATADPDAIVGDPEDCIDEWEFQGNTNRCALYSQKFVIEEITGEEVDMEAMADYAEENGWFTEEGGTPLGYMNKMLDEAGVENEMTFENDESDLREALSEGHKVIVSVDADEYWYGQDDDTYSPADGPNHAIQVIGIDDSDPENPMVIINDSGHPDGQGMMIPMDTFLDAWDDGGCQMIECY